MRIVLYGGTFDPPHFLHQLSAQKAFQVLKPDELRFVPTFQTKYYGLESQKKSTKPLHRLEMTKKILFPGSVVWDVEHEFRLDGQTKNLLPHLSNKDTNIFLIGSDQDITRWSDYRLLLEFMEFYVIPRYPLEKFPIKLIHPRMHVLMDEPAVDYEVDSTMIREHLRQGLGFAEPVGDSGKLLSELISRGVYEYSIEHDVYGEGSQSKKETK